MANKRVKNKRLIFGWLRKAEDDLAFAKTAEDRKIVRGYIQRLTKGQMKLSLTEA